jgi:hypothetical protein
MFWERSITAWVERSTLAIVLASACLSMGQAHHAQQPHQNQVPRPPAAGQGNRQGNPPPYARSESSGRQVSRPTQPPAQGHHAGQWLRQYKDVSPDQQRRALQNDPQFRRLPPQQQQRYEQRLQDFSRRPPEQQQRILNRMETWEHLTPPQKNDARQLHSELQQLPPGRRQAVQNAIQALRGMPPDARERALESGRFNDFSPQERNLLNGVSRLPLAPAQPPDGVPRPPQ